MKVESVISMSINRYISLEGLPEEHQYWKVYASIRNYFSPETDEERALSMAFTFNSHETYDQLRKTHFPTKKEAMSAAFTFFEDHSP